MILSTENKENHVLSSTPMQNKKLKSCDATACIISLTEQSVRNNLSAMPRKSIFHLSSNERKKFLKNVVATTRAAKLIELLTKPPLLFNPLFNIQMPFNRRLNSPPRRVPMKFRGLWADPDPCMLSLDACVDLFYAVDKLVKYFDTDEESSSAYVAKNFIKRLAYSLEHLDILRIGYNDFTVGDHIGSGACGSVRVVKEKHPPHRVFAMKSQQKNVWLYHDYDGQQMLLERTVLAQAATIANPWLPHLQYAFQDDNELHLVMDYEPGGDMYIYLGKAGQYLDLKMIKYYAAECVEAVHSLHKMGYIHCDIKPENLAIERSGHLKLLDFGSAIRLDADGKCICPTMVGTKEYLNIELLSQREHSSPILVGCEYDYWAIGVFLYELFYSITPFYDEDDSKMMEKIKFFPENLVFPSNNNITTDAKDLIKHLITFPTERLTYEGVTSHPFFQDVDFTSLRNRTPVYIPDVAEDGDSSKFSDFKGNRLRDEAVVRGEMIRIAVSTPENEPIPEMEEVDWDGESCLRALPFVGFSFTPGLLRSALPLSNQNIESIQTDAVIKRAEFENSFARFEAVEEKHLQNMDRECLVDSLKTRVTTLTKTLDLYRGEIKKKLSIESIHRPESEWFMKFKTLSEDHNRLILSTELARKVKLQSEELFSIINQLKSKIAENKTLHEDDVLVYLTEGTEDPNDFKLQHSVLFFLLDLLRSHQSIDNALQTSLNKLNNDRIIEQKNAFDRIHQLNTMIFQMTESFNKSDIERRSKEETLLKKIEFIKVQLEDSRIDRAKLSERFDEYASKYFAIKDELAKREEDFSKFFRVFLPDSVPTFDSRITSVACRFEETQEELKNIHQQLELKTTECETLKNEIDLLKKENKHLIDLEKFQSVERAEMEEKMNSIEEEKHKLLKELTKNQAEISSQLKESQLESNQLSKMKDIINDLKLENESLSHQIDKLYVAEEPRKILSNDLQNLQCRLNVVENDLLSMSCREASARKELLSNEKLIRDQHMEIEDLKKENERLNQVRVSLSPSQSKEDNVEKELKSISELKDRLQSELEHTRILLDQIRMNNRELSLKCDQSNLDSQELQYECESLSDQLDLIRTAYDAENIKLNQKINEQAKLISHMRTLIPENRLLLTHKPAKFKSIFFRNPSLHPMKCFVRTESFKNANEPSAGSSMFPLTNQRKSRSVGKLLKFRIHSEERYPTSCRETATDNNADFRHERPISAAFMRNSSTESHNENNSDDNTIFLQPLTSKLGCSKSTAVIDSQSNESYSFRKFRNVFSRRTHK